MNFWPTHPMMMVSATCSSDSMTGILVDTLEPPTMATKGFLGFLTAPSVAHTLGGKIKATNHHSAFLTIYR